MKVCHLTSVHRHCDVRIFYKECVTLAAAGYEVFLIELNTKTEEKDGVKIISIHYPIQSRFKRMTVGVWKIYREALKLNACIYHFHDPELMWAGWLLKRKGKKVVYDVHEDLTLQIYTKPYLPEFLKGMFSFMYSLIESFFVRKFDALITAEDLNAERLKKKNSKVISLNNYPEIKEAITSVFEKKSALCYAGGITEMRGINEMIESLRLAKTELILAGEFSPSSLSEKYLKQADNFISYRGYVSRDEVKKIYNQSIAGLLLLHPTKNYLRSMPIKMFEYMEAGLPIIASNFPLWKKIFEQYGCVIWVNPFDINEIAEAIVLLKENENLRNEMGLKARKAVIENFNWNAESKKLIQLYQSIL